MKDTAVKVIIHGHFYQPLREDPWTNEIDNQSSAYPFKNWNYRVSAECYGPNSYSRVLDENGMIKDIVNNYEYISFNYGPTLLSWLDKKEHEIYTNIIEADKKSIIKHNGHGNAIAQIYNHVIMPLQSFEDKVTQITWGLRDFEYRFGRKSEGIWLSETAVDYKTIDILIEQGIKFIILSPLQAAAIREHGKTDWISVKKTGIDTSIPYKIVRAHGEIAIFFYNKDLSTAISFEHLLRNSDELSYKLINNSNNKDGVVIVATDGEIYGHHEPFGDMCLSSLITRHSIEKHNIRFMNFGEYLSEVKPETEVNLFMGDDDLGSSWSCIHGVGRWYRDCGCKTGGNHEWNQKWRTPLRDSFDFLKNEIDKIFIEKCSPFVKDPWGMRNDYINFLISEYSDNPDTDFIEKHKSREITEDEKRVIVKLLDAEKNGMFAYTSCGWFFTELTGIETIQNIKFANKALSLVEEYSPGLRNAFENKISAAKSNIKEVNDGKWLLANWIYPSIQDQYHIANNFISLLKSDIAIDKTNLSLCSSFAYKNYKLKRQNMLSDVLRGNITISDMVSHIDHEFSFFLIKKSKINHLLYITKAKNETKLIENKDAICNETYNGPAFYKKLTEKNLLLEIKNMLLENDVDDLVRKVFNRNIESISDVKEIMSRYKEMDIDLSSGLSSFVKNTVEIYLHKISQELKDFPDDDLENDISSLFELLNHFKIKIEAFSLRTKFSEILYKSLFDDTDTESDKYSEAIKFINFTNKTGFIIEKSKLENRIFNILKNKLPQLVCELNAENSEDEKVKSMIKIRRIIMLSEIFNINTENEKKTFFATF